MIRTHVTGPGSVVRRAAVLATVLAAAMTMTMAGAGSAQTVTTLATGIATNGDLAVDSQGNCYIACEGADTVIRKITPEGVVSVFATGMGQSQGMAFDATGDTLYVARTTFLGPIRKLAPGPTPC
jgi:hypothetical protein